MNKKLLIATILVGLSFSIYAQCVQCAGTYEVLGTNASVMGTGCSATGHSAVAAGNSASASGDYSTVLGYNASASGAYSKAIGKFITASGSNAFVIGSGNSASTQLTNSIDNNIMFGMGSSTPSMTIRQNSAQNNMAYIGVGTTYPKKEFHVHGNVMISGSNNALLFANYDSSTTGDFGIKLSHGGLSFFLPNNSSNLLYIKANGNIGVGTINPKQMLHVVEGNILISRASAKNDKAPGSVNGSILFGDVATTQYPYGSWGIEYINDNNYGYGLNFWKTSDANYNNPMNYVLFLCEEGNYLGNVGIGTSRPKQKLSVNGTIQAKELIVTTLAADWPDFVFNPEYKLTSLHELDKYIGSEKHLPGVPSANEIGEEGIKVGEMNAILLQKVEELTLYVIELQKQIDELKTR